MEITINQSVDVKRTVNSQHDLSGNKNSQETQNSTLVTQSTEVSQLPQSTTTASSGSKGTVLLQMASAIARNEDSTKSTRVKILFDNGSQRSYVTDNLKSRLGLKCFTSIHLEKKPFENRNAMFQPCFLRTFIIIIIIIIILSAFLTANFTGYSRLLGEEIPRNHQAYKERPHRHHNIIRNKGCEEVRLN